MSEIDAARQSVRASLLLIVGNLATSIIGILTVFIIARFLGPEEYGLYTLALVPASLFILLAGCGINTAITRNSSYRLSRGEIDIARRENAHAIEFLLILGSLLTIIGFFSASFVSSSILHRPDATPYVQLASFSILGQVILSYSISSFVGWSSAGYASISAIVQSILKAGFIVVLLAFGFGVYGGVLGHTLSFLIAGCFGIVATYALKLHGKKSLLPVAGQSFLGDIKSQIRFGIPSEVGTNIAGFVSVTFIVILLSLLANNMVVGWFQAATNITIVITFVSSGLTVALFPAFTSLQGRSGDLRSAFKFAVKYTSFFVAPIILFVAIASHQLVDILYGASYVPSTPYLILLALGYLLVIVGLSTFNPFFNAVGKTRFTLWTNLSSVPPILLLGPILGHLFGAFGLIYAIIISDMVTCVVGLLLAKKFLLATIDYESSLKILISAVLSAIPVYLVSVILRVAIIPLFITEALVFVGLYLTISPILGALDSSDVARLRSAMHGIKIISRVVGLALDYEESLIRLTKGES